MLKKIFKNLTIDELILFFNLLCQDDLSEKDRFSVNNIQFAKIRWKHHSIRYSQIKDSLIEKRKTI